MNAAYAVNHTPLKKRQLHARQNTGRYFQNGLFAKCVGLAGKLDFLIQLQRKITPGNVNSGIVIIMM